MLSKNLLFLIVLRYVGGFFMWSSWLIFFLEQANWLHICLTNITALPPPPHIWFECTSFKICCWNVPDNGGEKFGCYNITIRLVCNLLWINFILILFLWLLTISSLGILILLSFNTDPPVKFLMVVILVVQEIYFFLQE